MRRGSALHFDARIVIDGPLRNGPQEEQEVCPNCQPHTVAEPVLTRWRFPDI